jgi:hypothetical protein
MHISIWQQFSSNHSSMFWVVGTFNTIQDARSAYDAIRQMLFAIDQWHREHPEEAWKARRTSFEALPPEKEYAEKFTVLWPMTIDWTGWGDYWYTQHSQQTNPDSRLTAERLIDEAISIVGRTITVTDPDQTWMTVHPFADILQRFGAETIGYDLEDPESLAEDFGVYSRLTFTAPDEAIADLLEEVFQSALNGSLYNDPPPWSDVLAIQKYLDSSTILRRADVEILLQNWQRYCRLHQATTSLTNGEAPIDRLSVRSQMGITRNGRTFIWRDVWFLHQELGLSAVIAYLESMGCDAIDFAYTR